MELDFITLKQAYAWKKIRGSADRLVFTKENGDMDPNQIVAGRAKVRRFDDTTARDLVYVAKIKDGGLISFMRKDGSYIHTLNTQETFDEKLAELGINL